MAPWLILVVSGLYLWTAIMLFIDNQPWMSLTFFAYAVSNIGLYKMAAGG